MTSTKEKRDQEQIEASLVEVSPSQEALSILSTIFQKGFGLEAYIGCSARTLLSEQWGLSSDFIRERVSIVFLDGKPLDDLDTAIVREKSTLVLSGAMPGLVGAAMKRGSIYTTLRNSITYRKVADEQTSRTGLIRVKLFNLLMRELGPTLLEKGIYVREEDLGSLPDGFVKSILQKDSRCQGNDLVFLRWEKKQEIIPPSVP